MDLEISVTRPGSFQKFKELNVLPERIIIFNWREWDYTSIGSEPSFENMVDYANLHDIPLYVLTGECPGFAPLHDITSPRYQRVHVVYFGTYIWNVFYELFLKDSTRNAEIRDPYAVNQNKEINFHYVSLNNKPHPHRCLQIDLLEKHGLIEYGAITWNSWYNDQGRILAKSFENYKWKYWQPRLMTFDEMNSDGWDWQLPDQYAHSFMQLVSECSPTAMMLSEKSLVPLLFNKPFLVSGPKDFHANLKNMGFELYDELFDYSFDSVDDMEKRFDLLTQNIVKYKNSSFEELSKLRKIILEKTVRNKRNLLRVISDVTLWPKFVVDLCESKINRMEEDNIYSYYHSYKHGIVKI